MLALSFLLLIGMSLILDGVGQHVPKGYIYFAMGFSVFVEMINLQSAQEVGAGGTAPTLRPDRSAGRRNNREKGLGDCRRQPVACSLLRDCPS